MAESVAVVKTIPQAINYVDWKGVGLKGYLVGDVKGSSPESLTGVWKTDLTDSTDLKDSIDECLAHFPGGQQVVGLVMVPKNAKSIKSIQEKDQGGIDREFEEVLGEFDSWLDQVNLSQMLCLCVWKDSTSDMLSQHTMFTISEEGVDFTQVDLKEKAAKTKIRMRLKADVPLVVSTESNSEEQLNTALDQELQRLQHQVSSHVYGFFDNSIILHQAGNVVVNSEDGAMVSTCKDVYRKWLELESEGGANISSKKKNSGIGLAFQTPVPVSMLLLARTETAPLLHYAPVIQHQTGSFKTSHLSLPLDVLVEVEEKTPVKELAGLFATGVSRQIVAMFQCLKNNKQKLFTPEVFHFLLPAVDIPVSVIYPLGKSEENLESQRKDLHNHLCLPQSVPLLRRGCAGHFLTRTTYSGYLLNTHIGLSDPSVKDATTCLVQGYYSYHHYMQDKFNDDKWGCAYRSLQTICSWFKYQGYTTKNIPTHREIQQALHDIGDKEQKFVGSRQWIGSFEVSFVLDHLLGVTSKFINVNSGAELSSIGQQLMEHFHSQGTPVMIGGGVLAHTILGVAYSELTGDIGFLILDPHYTGGEDLAVIQDKGWCGWKDMNFWNQTAHYNLCLPQRPTTSI